MGACLLILDFQNDLVHPEGAFRHWGIPFRVAEGRVLEHTAGLIAAARAAGVPVVYTTYVVRPELVGSPSPSRFFRLIAESGAMREGTWGGEIHAAVAPRPGDVIVRKWRPNPFFGTDLELVIRSIGAATLVLAGIVTEWVVEEAARHAAAAGYEVVIAADCCESARDDLRDHALGRILPRLGRVETAAVITRRWAGD